MAKTLQDLQREFEEYVFPISLENLLPHRFTRLLTRIVFLFWLFLGVPAFGLISEYELEGTIGFLLALIFLLTLLALDAVFYSYTFRSDKPPYTYESARMILGIKTSDPLRAFLQSSIGKRTLFRAGINIDDYNSFLQSRKSIVNPDSIILSDTKDSVESFLHALYDTNLEYRGFLDLHGVGVEDIWNSFLMEAKLAREKMANERWWSSEIVRSIHPIGREWAYGSAYFLSRYCEKLRFDTNITHGIHNEEAQRLQSVLMKGRGANALIVGDEGSGKMEVVEMLGREYLKADSSIQFLVFKTESFLTTIEDQVSFERGIQRILSEIVSAGNIILTFPDLPSLMRRSKDYNLEFSSLLAPYLRSADVHIVAISDLDDFHTLIEQDQEFNQYFENILVKDANREEVLAYFLDRYATIERNEHIQLSYPAIRESIQVASQYLVTSPLYHAATDVLYEAISFAQSNGKKIVTKEDVLHVVTVKTGLPTGSVTNAEKVILENLETHLSEKVVGQKEAIKAIADALRRARAGLNDPDRPLGSFMFLGPTGVGKTETAKALSEVFFGSEKNIMRLDMSEYQTPDAISRLLGSYGDQGAGILSNMIRENPYGVLLLDEFEKTHETVHDLFLQIIDEGIFRDAVGRKVSARNIIIIATTNAGSDMILERMKAGQDLSSARESIVNSIIEKHVFKPELLNRFDGIILFHALTNEDLSLIAKMALKSLAWRLKEKNITLIVNDDLIQFLVKQGSNPEFGARPLERAIQNTVESVIANGMLSGLYKPGSTIELHSADLI